MNIEGSKKDFRKFGFVVGVFLIILGVIIKYFGDSAISIYLIIPGVLLLIMALIIPRALKFPYKFWMILAFIMSWFMTRLLLGIIFYGAVTPIGIIAKLFGKQFLDVKINKSNKSYWNYRDSIDVVQVKSRYEKQF